MELSYTCVLFDERSKDAKSFIEKFKDGPWGYDVCRGAYRTEMSLITKLPETEFGIEPGLCIVAVSKDRKCVGFMNLYITINAPDTICIGHVYVRPEVRGKGVYKKMLERLEAFAHQIKAQRIVSFVHRSNGGSMKAHHNLGFKQQMVGFVKEVK